MNTLFRHSVLLGATLGIGSCASDKSGNNKEIEKPNIVIIYVDDLGYGDLSCYGATAFETPNVDNLAKEGLLFTHGYCAAATCSPSRYSLLTGSYAFRNNARILPGDAPLLIDTSMLTLPKMLQESGYTTSVIGKWHLGLGSGDLDWNTFISPGPAEVGFDYSFLIPATGDRVPSVFVENQLVVDLDPEDPVYVSYGERIGDWPTGLERPDMLKQAADTQHSGTITNGVSRIGFMTGGKSALWKDEDFPYILTEKAESFIEENASNPFFMFFSFHAIHVPRIVHPDFEGKSGLGPRGDHIIQMDWCTGEIMRILEENGLSEKTLVFFSSDNGPVLDDGYSDQAVELLGDHKPAAHLRGGKYSIFEAGTRMPTIAYWPGTIEPGESDAVFSQTDLLASLANMVDYEIPEGEAPDSYDLWDVLLGRSVEGRELLLLEAGTFALRSGPWKYIQPKKGPAILPVKFIESGLDMSPQLYNLIEDPGEQINRAREFPERVEEMEATLTKIISEGSGLR